MLSVREIRQCAVRPASDKDRCATSSILGPVLFITFMNDSILEISDIRFDMYADDSMLYTTDKCIADINQLLKTNSKPLYD